MELGAIRPLATAVLAFLMTCLIGVGSAGCSSPAPKAAVARPQHSSAIRSAGSRVPLPETRPSGQVRPVPRRLAGQVWNVLPTPRKVVAITVDGGWNAAGVASMLATLRRYHVRATFNLTGRFCRHYPASARAIAAAGELIGNLSNNHPHFTEIPPARMRMEVGYGQAEIERVTGRDPWPFFRFPYGSYDPRAVRVVNSAGFVPIGWTVDTLGWLGRPNGITVATVVQRVMTDLQPGEIVLMHFASSNYDRSILDADALPIVIRKIRAAGYSFVTMAALKQLVR